MSLPSKKLFLQPKIIPPRDICGVSKSGSFFIQDERYVRTIFDEVISSSPGYEPSSPTTSSPISGSNENSPDVQRKNPSPSTSSLLPTHFSEKIEKIDDEVIVYLDNSQEMKKMEEYSQSKEESKKIEESEDETENPVTKVESFIVKEEKIELEKKKKTKEKENVKRVKSYDTGSGTNEHKSWSLREKKSKKKAKYVFYLDEETFLIESNQKKKEKKSEKSLRRSKSVHDSSPQKEEQSKTEVSSPLRKITSRSQAPKSDPPPPTKSIFKTKKSEPEKSSEKVCEKKSKPEETKQETPPPIKPSPVMSRLKETKQPTIKVSSMEELPLEEDSKGNKESPPTPFRPGHRRTNSFEPGSLNSSPKMSRHRRHNSWDEKNNSEIDKPPSPETMVHVKEFKQYIEEYYWELLSYLNSRKKRLEKFQESLGEIAQNSFEMDISTREYQIEETTLLRSRRLCGRLSTDFKLLKRIGKGAFGEVFLCRKKNTNELMALKKISKAKLNIKNKIAHVKIEQNVLADASSLWLVQLYYAFQDSRYIYFAMEYIPGGDMRTFLDDIYEVGELSEGEAKFFIAEMFTAVDALHQLGYIHRDLKPDNFLRTKDGHIKLADFGLSIKGVIESYQEPFKGQLPTVQFSHNAAKRREIFKKQAKKAYSLVGSPDYMAVDLLRGGGYDFTADWWSLACILFELLVGFPPFTSDTPRNVFSNVMNYTIVLENPTTESGKLYIGEKAWNIITSLICEPEVRLKEFDDIKRHSFFKDIDWENLKNAEAPFPPKLENEEDTSYFKDAKPISEVQLEEEAEISFLEKINQLGPTNQFDDVNAFSKTIYTGGSSSKKKEEKKGISPLNKALLKIYARSENAAKKETNQLFDHTSLNQLSIRDWQVLCTGATRITRPSGTEIIKEGQNNTFLYRIKRGSVRIEKETKKGRIVVGRLEKNQVFGEMSFVEDNFDQESQSEGNVSASVIVDSDEAEFYKIDRGSVFSIFLADKDLFGRFYKIIALMLAERVVNLPFRKELHKMETEKKGSNSPSLDTSDQNVTLDLRPSSKNDPDKDKTKRDEKFVKRFKLPSPEVLIQSYESMLEKRRKYIGRLYIGENHLCFYSIIFGYRHKEVIPFHQIIQLDIADQDDRIDLVQIAGSIKEKYSFSFKSSKDAEDVFIMLDKFCRQTNQNNQTEVVLKTSPDQNENNSTSSLHGRKTSLGTRHRRNNSGQTQRHKRINSITDTGNLLEESSLQQEISLSQEDWNIILQGAKFLTFMKDEIILEPADESTNIYQIGRGNCRVEVQENGKTKVLGIMNNSEMFGEISFLNGTGATVSIVANENNTHIYCIEREYIAKLFEKIPGTAGKFYKFLSWVLARRIRQRESEALEEVMEEMD